MFSRRTLPVWAGLILLSGMFLMGQEDWGQTGPVLVMDNGSVKARIVTVPFGYEVLSANGELVTRTFDFSERHSLWYRRAGTMFYLTDLLSTAQDETGVALTYRTTEGVQARVAVRFHGDKAIRVDLGIDAAPGRLLAGQDLELSDREAVYGVAERIHWNYLWSEAIPLEIGSVDRRGEWFPMVTMPTIGIYAPFFQTSNGYGLYVDTTFYGSMDLGRFRNDRIRFEFQSEEGRDPSLAYYIFYGPSHDDILDQYTALTGRPFIPPRWAFKHMRWRNDHNIGDGELDGNVVNAELAEDVKMYDQLGFPIGSYMIDRPWTPGSMGFAEFSFDPVRFPNARDMLASLFNRGYRFYIWGAPWAIGFEPGQNGYEARAHGYFAPDQEKHIDFSNPAAFDWWKDKVRDFSLEYNVRGWKLDRGEEDHPSFAGDVYFDGRTGVEMRNAYPLLYHKCYHDAMREAWGDDFFITIRAGWAGSQRYGVPWGGDTRAILPAPWNTSTDLGLRSAILSQLHCAFLGYPFWGSDTGGYTEFRDREVFARWLQFSAFSGFMEIGGDGNRAPWDMPTEPRYDEEMIDIYRTYTQLHHDLVDYMYAFAVNESVVGRPLVRPMVFDYPDDPAVKGMWDQYFFGRQILVAPVWQSGLRERQVYIPEGAFVDYWDPGTVHAGPKTITVEAPLDRIPFFIREGTEILGRVW